MNEIAKKGKPTWKPANVLDVFDKEEGYTYRILEKSPRNLAKKEREGWEILSGVSGTKTNVETGYGRINDGKPLTSVLEGSDWIIGRLPNDLKEARDEYQNNKVAQKEQALKRQVQQELTKEGAPTHGSISIERKGIRTVIE